MQKSVKTVVKNWYKVSKITREKSHIIVQKKGNKNCQKNLQTKKCSKKFKKELKHSRKVQKCLKKRQQTNLYDMSLKMLESDKRRKKKTP